MQMRKVELGTFDCGACQVAFTEKAIRFYPAEASRFQPKGYHEEIELEMSALTSIKIDKQRGLMCVTGFFGYDVPEHYNCMAVENSPQSRALFHFDTTEGDGVWSGSDRDKRVKSLMRLSPEIRNKTNFNPGQIDFAAELQRFKRRQLGEEHVAKPPKPAAGRGSRAPPPSSRGHSLLQAATSGSGSGGAGRGRGSGSAGTSRFPGQGQRVDGKRTDGTPPIDQFMTGATSRPMERERTNHRPQRSTRSSSYWGDVSGVKRRGVNKKAPIHPRPHPYPHPPPPSPPRRPPTLAPTLAPPNPNPNPHPHPNPNPNPNPNPTKVLIYPEETAKDAVTLTEEECDRLDEKEFLNDSLVDYELKRIQAAALQPEGLEAATLGARGCNPRS